MFDTFIINLRQRCIEKSIDSEPLVEKYRKRFQLGITAGLDEKEIVARFGKIEDIVNEAYNAINSKTLNKDDKNDNISGKYVVDLLKLKVMHAGNLYIRQCKGHQISYQIPSSIERHYNIVSNKNELSIVGKFKSSVTNIRGNIIIDIGDEITFKKIEIETCIADLEAKTFNPKAEEIKISLLSADGIINDVKGQNVDISTVSGDFKINKLNADRLLRISTLSGDYRIRNIKGRDVQLASVSGDIVADNVVIKNLDCSSVSGDMKINGIVESSRLSSISGDIYINKIKGSNKKDEIKSAFRKDK